MHFLAVVDIRNNWQQGMSETADSAPSAATCGYFKRTSFSCRYIRRDIMCKHDVMNIQHTHFGLVDPDRGARKVGQ